MTTPRPNRYFTETYDHSRLQFRNALPLVRRKWSDAKFLEGAVSKAGVRELDAISAQAAIEPQRKLVVTSGLHGIEGYVGGAILQCFVEEMMQGLDANNTGLLLIHPINPIGMKRRRRTNASNVDLNRNFLPDPGAYDTDFNPDYDTIFRLLNPQRTIRSKLSAKLRFISGLLRALIKLGPRRMQVAALLGQYRYPQGFYYGGAENQPETKLVRDLIAKEIENYEDVVFIDIHSGYGPHSQLTLVNSPLEAKRPEVVSDEFGYPHVVTLDSDSFFPIQGDMLDYFYARTGESASRKTFFATAFEFGTVGGSLKAGLRSLRAIVLENQLRQFGCADKAAEQWIRREYQELFAPSDPEWKREAVEQARIAFRGILTARGFY